MYTSGMMSIPLSEARAGFFDLVERASAGERITLASRGVPLAMLVPLSDDPRPQTFTSEQALDILRSHQMDAAAWDAVRHVGDTIGEDGLG